MSSSCCLCVLSSCPSPWKAFPGICARLPPFTVFHLDTQALLGALSPAVSPQSSHQLSMATTCPGRTPGPVSVTFSASHTLVPQRCPSTHCHRHTHEHSPVSLSRAAWSTSCRPRPLPEDGLGPALTWRTAQACASSLRGGRPACGR